MSDFDDRHVRRRNTCECCHYVLPLQVYFEDEGIHDVEPFCMLGVSMEDVNYICDSDTEDKESYSPRFLKIMRLYEGEQLVASCRRTCRTNICQFFRDELGRKSKEEEKDA